jgi:hypothetical protein
MRIRVALSSSTSVECRLRERLLEVTARDSTLQGWRTQALFEAIVASLGSVQLLKLEDVGDVYFSGPDLQPPDFRIVTESGEQILVEVKNFYQRKNETADFRVRTSDLEAWLEYTNRVVLDSLKLAIYWVRWNVWTLVDSKVLRPGDDKCSISLPDALMANEMGVLGDRTIATEWPIGFTVFTDPSQPRTVDESGDVSFTVAAAEYSVAGRTVTDPSEQKIVHRLMLHGGWPEKAEAKVLDGEPVSVSFTFSPAEPPPPPQSFAMHSPLSSIFSNIFMEATAGEQGEITQLRLDADPGALAGLIPDDYEGETLKIWRFHQMPPKV